MISIFILTEPLGSSPQSCASTIQLDELNPFGYGIGNHVFAGECASIICEI